MTDSAWFDRLQWRCIGPFRGGRSVAVAGDPNDPNIFYFGTTGGGVWKTIDGGNYWRNVSDGFFKRASVGGLAVSHSDPNVIYAGMGETTIRGNVSHGDGVYKSTDGGATWQHVGLEATRNIGRVRIDPRDPNIVFVAAFGHAHGPNPERGVYRSKDGGVSWELVLTRGDDAGADDLSIDPRNPRIVYAGFWEARRGPYFMTSGGQGSGLFRSRDGGDTWDDLTEKPGMPKGLKGKIGVVASPAQSGRVWAMVENEDGGVFRSDDFGETWERLNDDRVLRQRAWYYSHIFADPEDPNTVWVLNVEMYRSVDGGKTFELVPAPHGDNHDLWFDPANPKRVILGNDGGGTISFNGGQSWSSQYSQPTSEMYHVTADIRVPYRVYGSQQDNTSISVPSRSNFGVITRTEWHEIGGGEAGYIAVRPDDPNIVFAGEYQGYMTRYDHTAGLTRNISVWPDEYTGSGAKDYKYRFQWTYPIILSRHNPSVLYCSANVIFRSTNEGSSWEPISPDLTRNDPSTHEPSGGDITKDNTGTEIYGTIFTLAESPLDPDILWAGSDDGLIHLSKDGGKSWTNVTPDVLPEWSLMSIIEASPHDTATAYVAANRYKHDDFRPYLLKTEDFGASWRRIDEGIREDDFTRVIREDPERKGLLYAGTETGIYVSFDDGGSWSRLGGDFPTVPVHDLIIHQGDLVVGTHGRSFWILDDASIFRQLADHNDSTSEPTLFKPRDTYRFGSMPTFGHKPSVGQNYWFAATQTPAYDFEKLPDGETKKRYLDAGENPSDGVIIYYLLPEETIDLTLTILDDQGNELRSFRPKPPETKNDDEERFPPPETPEEPEGPFAPVKEGLNRFVWDFRLPEATKIVTKGGDQPDRTGPRVPPGEYQVRLATGDQERTETFTVLADPRVASRPRDYQVQFDLLKRIHDKHDQLNQAVNKIRQIREDLILFARRIEKSNGDASFVVRAKSLSAQLDEIEGTLLQRKIQSDQDSLNYPVKLNAKLAAIAYMVGVSESPPTKQATELYRELAQQVDGQIAELSSLERKELKAFNKDAKRAGLDPVRS
jgi:photosystem II stability/assembly factor-like uncharacterized protein